jgi:trehalose 6-phosphate synthase
MNLVAKEFVASQDPPIRGFSAVAVAGAARELTLRQLSTVDVDQIADALDRALAMPVEERRERHATMMLQLDTHNVHVWRDSFLDALQQPDGVFTMSSPMAAE